MCLTLSGQDRRDLAKTIEEIADSGFTTGVWDAVSQAP